MPLFRRKKQSAAPVHDLDANAVAIHYMLPIMSAMRSAVAALRQAPSLESLLADAGAMYAAKAAGIAKSFDVFTPDPGEVGFLADPDASHPAYVQHHILEMDNRDVPELMREAYAHGSASGTVIVKGKTDYVFVQSRVVAQIHEPDVPALEAIGGTGDTITGLTAGFMSAGIAPLAQRNWQRSVTGTPGCWLTQHRRHR